MTLETFYEHFELLSDAPNALPKLREMVLQLAARGALVHQSGAEKGVSSTVRFNADISNAEVPHPLPESWVWMRLGDVVEYNAGQRVESARISEDAWLLELEDIEKDSSVILKRLTAGQRQSKSTKSSFLPNDVLYGKLRPYLNKVVVADSPGYCTTEIVPLRPCDLLEPKYLMYMLKRPDFLSYVNSKTYGINLPRLGTSDGRNALIPLAPLEEQRRIVAKVDELMALCDDLEQKQQARAEGRTRLNAAVLTGLSSAPNEASFRRAWVRVGSAFDMLYSTPETIADLRRGVLQLAVQGKLVRQDPDDCPITVLVKETDAKNVPVNWVATKLGSCIELISGQHLKPDEYNADGNGIPYLTGPADFGKYEPTASRWSTVRRAVASKGDILLTVKGAGIGKTNKISYDEAAISRQLMAIRPVLIEGNFVHLYLQTLVESFQDMRTGIAIPGIGRSDVLDYPIFLPPLAEQKRIVAKVDGLIGLLDELENGLLRARGDAERLLEAVLQSLLSADKQPALA